MLLPLPHVPPSPTCRDAMPDDDPDKLIGPGGMTLRQIHEQVKQSAERDRRDRVAPSKSAPPQSRWQRFVRYVWNRKRPQP